MPNFDQMLAIASHKASDRIHHAAAHAGQAGRTAMRIVSCPRRKRTRTDRLRRQDASAGCVGSLEMPLEHISNSHVPRAAHCFPPLEAPNTSVGTKEKRFLQWALQIIARSTGAHTSLHSIRSNKFQKFSNKFSICYYNISK
jgi:hypothetical protein